MALNIKNAEVEALAAEIARITGESKTEAVRRALAERKTRLSNGPIFSLTMISLTVISVRQYLHHRLRRTPPP